MRAPAATLARTVLSRGALFFGLWLVLLPSLKPADLAVGLIATVAATWTSVHLMPPEVGYVRLLPLLAFVPHFLWQSVLAGVDVARRAMRPHMRLKPGFIASPVKLPPGLARNDFVSIMSLMPGSVPVDETEHSVIFHCLDTDQPLAEQMAKEERLLTNALVVVAEEDSRG
ncbi:Na+/H+ antiporter subunit E [Variovorax sp. YR216]|uniref:Na+/H+ antiporter subunit E n=1 Tax=Variovorax sp. YR216 TaxID=1882828 RepID=UPI00089B83AF|nr:Na+/H+ antiporter subunit E [Variovorax sp. YR216]SEA95796.1 multisubunit sodium/proton antiporter, MrpE subunit [Variovorax sp. YR216]